MFSLFVGIPDEIRRANSHETFITNKFPTSLLYFSYDFLTIILNWTSYDNQKIQNQVHPDFGAARMASEA